MGIITCKECGNEISSRAKICPSCGAPSSGKKGFSLARAGFFAALVLIIFIGIASQPSRSPTPTAAITQTTVNDKPSQNEPALSPIESYQNYRKEQLVERNGELDRIESGLLELTADDCTVDKDELALCLAKIEIWAQTLNRARAQDDDALLSRSLAIQKKLSVWQRRELPRIRDKFGPMLRRTLWIHDGSGRTIGRGYRIVEFVAPHFALNRNIAEVQQSVALLLKKMRFNQSRFKWYDEADEYQYYDIASPRDSAVGYWSNQAFIELSD